MEKNCCQPYTFRSGRYKEHSVEEIIFEDPIFIARLLDLKDKNKASDNALYRHLRVLMDSFPKTVSKCPVCHQKSVKYFLYLNNETVSKDLICCDNPACQEILKRNHLNDYLLPMKLSSILVFNRQKTLRKKVINLFKRVTGLRGKPRADKIFDIFVGRPTVPIDTQLSIF